LIAVDTSILVYAHRVDSQWHGEAQSSVQGLAEGTSQWAIPWPCLHEFLAIVTHPRIYRPATPLPLAIDQIEAWMESPRLVLLAETAEHWEYLRRAAVPAKIAGAQTHDARIAALCLQHGVSELWTADRDFSRFAALKTRNSLA
jgi:hypothetical protein